MTQVIEHSDIPEHLQRDFTFQTVGILPPDGITFGFNTVKNVGTLAKKSNKTRALLITDDVMVKLGYADMVSESLEKEEIGFEIFSKVEPEPHLRTAEALHGMVQRREFDLVIGLGGGSVLDMAKLISIVATNDLSPYEFMSKKRSATKPGLKKILIPTTSGTGSEVSRFIVISADGAKYGSSSSYAYADIVIIDPGLTVSMPPVITAITGIDALSHAIDAIMNKYPNPFFDALAFGGIELISKYLRRAFLIGNDLEARYYMSMGATMSMIAMDGKGVALYSHSISYVLAGFKPIPHGIGSGMALPYTMASNLPIIEERLALIARSMGDKVETVSPRAAGQRAIELVYGLIADVGMPLSLKELGYQYDDLLEMADMCITKHKREYNPRIMSKEECLLIFEAMWEGKIRQLI